MSSAHTHEIYCYECVSLGLFVCIDTCRFRVLGAETLDGLLIRREETRGAGSKCGSLWYSLSIVEPLMEVLSSFFFVQPPFFFPLQTQHRRSRSLTVSTLVRGSSRHSPDSGPLINFWWSIKNVLPADDSGRAIPSVLNVFRSIIGDSPSNLLPTFSNGTFIYVAHCCTLIFTRASFRSTLYTEQFLFCFRFLTISSASFEILFYLSSWVLNQSLEMSHSDLLTLFQIPSGFLSGSKWHIFCFIIFKCSYFNCYVVRDENVHFIDCKRGFH